MKVTIEIIAETDTELLEGILSTFNRLVTDLDTLDKLDQGVKICKYGTLPSYEIRKSDK